jgi:ribosomal protein L37E
MQPNSTVIITALALIAAVLTIWGASLLYRALDGDRVTLRSSTRSRWTNRVSRPLLTVSLLAILFGSLLSFAILYVVASIALDRSALVYAAVSVSIYSTSIIVLAWAWAGRRARGHLRRCPACSYDVSTIETQTCPECGFFARTPTMWQKPIKRRRGLVIGSLLAIFAIALIALPPIFKYNPRRIIPTGLMVSTARYLPDSYIGGSNELYYAGAPEGSLFARIQSGKLTAQQVEDLTELIETQLPEASDISEVLKWTTLASTLGMPRPIPFTRDQATRFLEIVLEPVPPLLSSSWGDLAPTVLWDGLLVIPPERAKADAKELALLARSTMDPSLSQLRWSIAFALDPESDALFDAFVSMVTSRLPPFDDSYRTSLFIQSLDHPIADRVCDAFWKEWLTEKNAAKAQIALETVTFIPRKPRSWPPELEEAIWKKTVDALYKDLKNTPDDFNSFYVNYSYPLEKRAFVQLLKASHEQTLVNHIQTDQLTPEDILVLQYGMPVRPTVLTVPMILGLLDHDDKQVRKAAAHAIMHRIAFIAMNPKQSEQINNLEPTALNQSLITELERVQETQKAWIRQQNASDD